VNIYDYEWYGDNLIYNPIHDVPEKDMTPEEFKEYLEVIEKKKNRDKNTN